MAVTIMRVIIKSRDWQLSSDDLLIAQVTSVRRRSESVQFEDVLFRPEHWPTESHIYTKPESFKLQKEINSQNPYV